MLPHFTNPQSMRAISFGAPPSPNAPRRRVIEQSSSPVREQGTHTKSATARRRSVLSSNNAPPASNALSNAKGKQRQQDALLHSDSECSPSTSRASFTEDDCSSLKENGGRAEDGTGKDVAMDLVTSVSTGSLMHQAMQEASTGRKRDRRRKAGRRIPLHGKHPVVPLHESTFDHVFLNKMTSACDIFSYLLRSQSK